MALTVATEQDEVLAAFAVLIAAGEDVVGEALDRLAGLDVNARARARVAIGLLRDDVDKTRFWLDALANIEASERQWAYADR